jgi:ankyrin repeat protein
VNDDIEALELLLPHCDDVDHLYISRFHQFKRTALYYARNPKAIEILIKNGADVKKAPEGNYYFFYHAILDKNLSLIKMLSDKGADASGLNIYGRMPLVLHAIKEGFLEAIPMLIANHADINKHDNSGTALIEAVKLGNI